MLGQAWLSALFVHAFDLEKMVAFYRDTLGLEVYFEEPGQCTFFRTTGGGPSLALYAGREPGQVGCNHWFVMFDVPDLDATVSALQARGVGAGPIQAVPYGRMVLFSDPEGNIIEVREPVMTPAE
ncbi:MAG: VOC family protein [Bacillota bacterium]